MNVTSFSWFARHELSLSWRDLYAMLSGNKAGRTGKIISVLLLVILGLHLLAYLILNQYFSSDTRKLAIDKKALILISSFLILPISLMLSQSIESITRAFYSRSDLELILSSPAPSSKLFKIRMASIALATTTMTMFACAPALNVLAWLDNPGWLYGYFVIICTGLLATSLGIFMTMVMFKIIGPKKTRLIAQIFAAVVGAIFVVGIQIFAIASIGSISRIKFLNSDYLASHMPSEESFLWLPAKAASGDSLSALIFAIITICIFGTTLLAYSQKFGITVLKASSADQTTSAGRQSKITFKSKSAAAVLRQKEWKLLLRDKWLFSQTLMQLFYLVPPAFMLWQGYGQGQSVAFIAVPVLVMAAGQLAGGLAWLAISGEDAPELVTTAPIAKNAVVRAKIEAVLTAVGIVTLPLIIALLLFSPRAGLIAIACIAASGVSATAIQLWFKTQAKRSSFRRRQTSSRVATFSEAFSSIFWAGTAGIWIAFSFLFAMILAAVTLLMLTFVWWISPARETQIN